MRKTRKSAPTVREFSNPPNGWSLKELIFHLFLQKGVDEKDLIHEFCEFHYGPLWDVFIDFEAFCFDNPHHKLPRWIDQFLEKKMR